MRISLIQDKIVWADKQANLSKTEETLQKLKGETDLVVLPEMFTTGFCTDQLELAEDMNGTTVTQLCSWAKEFEFAIAGSFIAKENSKIFNRAFFIQPNGQIDTSDKRHLFSMGGENKYFEAGDKRLQVNYKGVNICILVCYDVRFPVWSRNYHNEYDLLIYIANFPKRRIAVWDMLLKARAIENQSYVCGVNCIGTDGLGLEYNGHSVLLDFHGSPILSFHENEAGVKTHHIKMEGLHQHREVFPFWKDADEFQFINCSDYNC